MKPIVVIESPYAGDIARNTAYARRAMQDSLLRGEAPVVSHLLYTQPGVLRDDVPGEREMGMEAGWEFFRVADRVAVYIDNGMSGGMEAGISRAKEMGIPVEMRSIE